MSAPRFTPGPWVVSEMTPSRVDTPDGAISISWRATMDGGERERKAEAAARLIAAAPELYAALRLMFDNSSRADWPADIHNAAEAALAKVGAK